MDFYLINEKTLPQVAELWDYCFEKHQEPFFEWYFSQYCLKQNKIVGGFSGKEHLCVMLHLNPFFIRNGGDTQQVPYIVGVATNPVDRGHGLTGRLLETTFALLRAGGTVMTMLKPIDSAIYRRSGMAYTVFKLRYELPVAALPSGVDVPLPIAFRRFASPLAALELLPDVYGRSLSSYNFVAERTPQQWRNLLTVADMEGMELLLAYDDGEPVGYMLYALREDRFAVQELLAIEGGVKRKLISYARGFISKERIFSWDAPMDDLTYLSFRDAYRPTLLPSMMARVINTEAALLSLQNVDSSLHGSFSLFVQDGFMPANNTMLRVDVAGGKVTTGVATERPDIMMGIDTFTQLFCGSFSVENLTREGRICGNNPDAFLLLERLFPIRVNYINEEF